METQFSRNSATDYRDNLTTRDNLAANALTGPSAVSWGAIFAGAAAAAALSLILLILGTGLGFSSVSAWSDKGISGTTFSLTTILWVTLTSLVASAIGGYIAGRLRNRWIATASDEVYFRDTAHGFLAWAVATLATATLLTSVVSAIVGAGAEAGAKIVGGAAATTAASAAAATATKTNGADNTEDALNLDSTVTPYFLDMLFRRNVLAASDASAAAATAAPGQTPAPAPTSAAAPVPTPGPTTPPTTEPAPGTDASKAEVARIYINALATGSLPAADAQYAAQVVSQTTGLSQAEAEKRVNDVFKTLQTKMRNAETAAREAAETARKATAYGSLWLFVSLLAGAFIASVTAIFGGRQRDL